MNFEKWIFQNDKFHFKKSNLDDYEWNFPNP